MLNAILKGKKCGIMIDEELQTVKFTGKEDLLTASVFERLIYLSDSTLRTILGHLPDSSGKLKQLIMNEVLTNS